MNETIYIIFDDCPQDFADKNIIKIFVNKHRAEQYLNNAKRRRPFETQYYVIQRHSLSLELPRGGRK